MRVSEIRVKRIRVNQGLGVSKKKFVFTSRGPLIVRTISGAVDFSVSSKRFLM